MYTTRKVNKEFTKSQFALRESIIGMNGSSKLGLAGVSNLLKEIVFNIETLKKSVLDTYDEKYFEILGLFFRTIGQHVGFITALQSGEGSSDALSKSVAFNLSHLNELIEPIVSSRPSIERLGKLASEIAGCMSFGTLFSKIDDLSQISLPFVHGIETNPYADFRRHLSSDHAEESTSASEPLIISVKFSTDNEPWANPQVLMPVRQYAIKGKIKLNYIPNNYSMLCIRHVSTTNDDFFILSLPEIKLTDELEYDISGQVVFKYAQSSFDPAISIKIIAQLISSSELPLYPQLIGYDELISKVIDDKVFKYPTGFTKLNKKAVEIVTEIKNELPDIELQELEHFTILLSAIMNYSGYCSTYGIYKGKDNITEDEFRDRLIAYMFSNPILTSSLIKESHVAGGRVEIRYENIIAELKVEKQISDRKKMLDKYSKQPTVYGAALSSDLSILCILDLTPKKLPSAPASGNVFTLSAPLHGFEQEPVTSKVVAVIIDGNLKNPSSY
jgi:hypothetical protein